MARTIKSKARGKGSIRKLNQRLEAMGTSPRLGHSRQAKMRVGQMRELVARYH